DGLVARLAAAAGEDDFVGCGAEQIRHLAPRLLDGVVRGLAVGVGTRRVAEVPLEKWKNRLQHGGIDGRRGVVGGIDRVHGESVAGAIQAKKAKDLATPRTESRRVRTISGRGPQPSPCLFQTPAWARRSNMSKQATPDHPVHELIARRWSPYAFADRP